MRLATSKLPKRPTSGIEVATLGRHKEKVPPAQRSPPTAPDTIQGNAESVSHSVDLYSNAEGYRLNNLSAHFEE